MVAGFAGEFQKSSLVKGKRRRVRRKVDLGCLAMEGRWEELYGASGLAFLGLFYLLVSVSLMIQEELKTMNNLQSKKKSCINNVFP